MERGETPGTQADLEARAPRSGYGPRSPACTAARASRAYKRQRHRDARWSGAEAADATPAGSWSPRPGSAGVARAARAIAQELRLRRDTRALMAADDRMLKDIGLTRAEVGGMAVRQGLTGPHTSDLRQSMCPVQSTPIRGQDLFEAAA